MISELLRDLRSDPDHIVIDLVEGLLLAHIVIIKSLMRPFDLSSCGFEIDGKLAQIKLLAFKVDLSFRLICE